MEHGGAAKLLMVFQCFSVLPVMARVPSQSVLSEEIAEDKEAGKNARQGRVHSNLTAGIVEFYERCDVER